MIPVQTHHPKSQAIEHSLRLITFIRNEIEKKGGVISFETFMNHALYAPGLGYYCSGNEIIGPKGDFITAPETSPLFAGCIANHAAKLMQTVSEPIIFEIGAGLGSLAADLLLSLEKLNALPTEYWILELSPDLQLRQKQQIEKRCPHLLSKLRWLNTLPSQAFNGLILGNEVLDALPVTCFTIEQDTVQELGVAWQDDHFVWQMIPASAELANNIRSVENKHSPFAHGFRSEINLRLHDWLKSITSLLRTGEVLWIDYGYSRDEYYSANHQTGTLQSYYQHTVNDDILCSPGLQDITAHVDFTRVAEAAIALSMHVAGYTCQSAFLLDCGIETLLQDAMAQPDANGLKLTQQVKKLLSPFAMGESFKVIVLTKDYTGNLLGFQSHSLLHKL